MLIVKLGQLKVETEEQKTISDLSVRKLYLQGSTEEEIFSSILSESYTKFNCSLTGIQVMYTGLFYWYELFSESDKN